MRVLLLTFILSVLVVNSSSCGNADGPVDTETGTIETSTSWHLHDQVGSLVYVSWQQDEAGTVHVEFEFEGQWISTPPFEATPGPQEQLIAGIPYEMEANWRVVQDDGTTLQGETITTANVPSGLPIAELLVWNEDEWYSKGNYLLTSINQENGGWVGGIYWTFIIDRQGRPVWALETPLENWTLFAQISQSGDHILWDEASRWNLWDDGEASKVHYTYLDEEIKVVSTPGLHHAFLELPDGTLAWGSLFHDEKETLVEKAPNAKDETVIWHCIDDWLEPLSSCESNGLFYQESTNSYLYSFYTNSSLVEIDRNTGQSLWWAGNVDLGYAFNPEESQFSWQHGISYTDAGTLLVSTAASGTTQVYEYQVDHANETLTLEWSFDPEVHASTNGDAWRLEDGNTLHLVGSAGHILEVDPEGTVVWHLNFPGDRLLGRGEFIEDLYDLVSN